MLNCLNTLQPSSDSEPICAIYYKLYTNIHAYVIKVFSTYVFPNVFQIQLWLRHLFLLLRSFRAMKLLGCDENKPFSLLLPSRLAEPALYWALGDACITATLSTTNPRLVEQNRSPATSLNFSIPELLRQGVPILV